MMVNGPEDRLGTLPITQVLQHALCQEQNVHEEADSLEKSEGAIFVHEE